MVKKLTLIVVSLLVVAGIIAGSLASRGGGPSKVQANLDEGFYLSVGQHASIETENLGIKFERVTEDSRCPRGVTCVWAGRVTCAVEFTQAGSSSHISLTDSGLTNEYAKDTYDGYELSFKVTPYPEAGKKISTDDYRLYLIVSKQPQLTALLGSVIAEPLSFEGQDIQIVGYYRGWDLLHEANTTPPVSRSDWVIKDSTGATYVSAASAAQVPQGLQPDSTENTGTILKVKGVVRITDGGQPYIEATSITLAS